MLHAFECSIAMAVSLIRRCLFRNQKSVVVYTLIFLSLLSSFSFLIIFWYTFENDVISVWNEENSLMAQYLNPKHLASDDSRKLLLHSGKKSPDHYVYFNFTRSNTFLYELPSKIGIQSKNFCSLLSPLLVGWMDISAMLTGSLKGETEKPHLKLGGRYKPMNCQSRDKVAIVVPYRQRFEHLNIFLRYMHPFLQRQQLEYAVFIVEQTDGLPFNRGMLMNIGFQEATKQDSFECFIFHDVDLLPEDDRNLYTCPQDGKPRHMAFLMDIYDYEPAPSSYFGGVNAFKTADFRLINGFSNVYWGWGSEDDDLYHRLLHHNFTVVRRFQSEPSLVHVTRYKMLDHTWVNPNPDRERLFSEGKFRQKRDGLISLEYLILNKELTSLYTHILVDLKPN